MHSFGDGGSPHRSPHLAINAIFLEPQVGGLATYVRELVPSLASVAPDLRITVFVNSAGRDYLEAQSLPDSVSLATSKIVGRRGTRAIGELTVMGRIAARAGADLLYSPALTGPIAGPIPHVVMIADVVWMTRKDPVLGLTGRLWRAVVPYTARAADRVITISQSSRRQISELLHVPSSRIDVTYLGFRPREGQRSTPPDELRRRMRLGDGPLVLCVSQIKLHKNLPRLVRAVSKLRERHPDLVLVIPGVATIHQQELEALATSLGLRDAVVFPGWVSETDLEGLYRTASCFVLPSLEEGFGLPILEAMARGLPVACTSASAPPEVAGDAARYFDPGDVDAMALAIGTLLDDKGVAEQCIAAGRRRVKEFTWERCARETVSSLAHAGLVVSRSSTVAVG